MRWARSLVLIFLFVAVSLGITLTVGMAFLAVPRADASAIAVLFAEVGSGVALLAFLVMQPFLRGSRGGVRGQLLATGLVGNLLVLGMLLAAARAMFISPHDLTLLLLMVLFAALLGVGWSLLYAVPLAHRIERVRHATAEFARGKLDTMLLVQGHDEIALLADDFNHMAGVLRQAADQEHALEQSRRDLIAAVSHDLRTPLAATQALIEALADDMVDDPATEKRYLRSAQRQIVHLSQLVDDLFELAQIDAGVLRVTLERASLRDLLSDTLQSFQPQAQEHGVRLVGEVAGDIDPVLMSPPKLQRVLHNLLGNALRHTPSDGTIFLRATPHGGLVEVEVQDTGEGILPADLPHIFERAFRGERSRTRHATQPASGAGLGLTIAKGLVEAQGGTLAVWSEPGNGTRVAFTLPRA